MLQQPIFYIGFNPICLYPQFQKNIDYNSKKKEGIYFLDEVCSFMFIV